MTNTKAENYYGYDTRIFIVTADNGDGTYNVRLVDKAGSAVGDTYVASPFSGEDPDVSVGDRVQCSWMYDGDDFSTRTLHIISAASTPAGASTLYAGWYKINTVNAGPTFDIQAVYADGNVYGTEYEAVTVMDNHSSALAVDDIVFAAPVPTSAADPTQIMKIYNAFWISTS